MLKKKRSFNKFLSKVLKSEKHAGIVEVRNVDLQSLYASWVRKLSTGLRRCSEPLIRGLIFLLGSLYFSVLILPFSEAIDVPNGQDPDDYIDTKNKWAGVGKSFLFSRYNSFRCTASLINPRVVITAAHCTYGLRGQEPESIGQKGNAPMGISFLSNTKSAFDLLDNWITLGQAFLPIPREKLYIVLDAIAHPGYVDSSSSDIEDVAFLTLSTPVLDESIPTYSLLLSRLSGPVHATLVGYGVTGTAQDIRDRTTRFTYKRHVGENMVDALISFESWSSVFFARPGSPERGYYYFLDFDDPDFPGHHSISGGGALEREVSTDFGDSGGPLLIDQEYIKPVIAGVLCCGIGGVYANGYGGSSGYTPLFMYANWLAENNPYKYVEWKGGDADWTEAMGWYQFLDPAFLYDDGAGGLKNGIPDKDKIRIEAASFGTIHKSDQTESKRFNQTPKPVTYLTNPVLSRNFVPDNDYGDQGVDGTRPAKFYEVWLRNAGKLSLSGDVEIDRLKLKNRDAALNIRSDGSLTVNIDVVSEAGRLNVDGLLRTPELTMMTGLLSGTGRIEAPSVYVVGGVLSPKSNTEVGTLTVDGDLILTSLSIHLVNLSSSQSDQVIVTKDLSLNGRLMLNLLLKGINIEDVLDNQYTLATSGRNISGNYSSIEGLTGVYYGKVTIEEGKVSLKVGAQDYLTYLGAMAQSGENASTVTGLASSLGSLQALYMDKASAQAQGNSSSRALIQALNTLSPVQLRNALEQFSPYQTFATDQMARAQTDQITHQYSQRVRDVRQGVVGLHLSGFRPLSRREGIRIASLEGFSAAANFVDEQAQAVRVASSEVRENTKKKKEKTRKGSLAQSGAREETSMKEGWSLYLTGGYIYGEAPTPTGKEDISSYYGLFGIDKAINKDLTLGVSLDYSSGDGNSSLAVGAMSAKSYGVTAYGSFTQGKYYVDAYAGLGKVQEETERSITINSSIFTAKASPEATRYLMGAELGYDMKVDKVSVSPFVSLRYLQAKLGSYTETGSAIAEKFVGRSLSSTQGEIGVSAYRNFKVSLKKNHSFHLTPYGRVSLVYELSHSGDIVRSSLVSAPDHRVLAYANTSSDGSKVWGDISGGISAQTSSTSSVYLGLSHTIGREHLNYGTISAQFSFKF